MHISISIGRDSVAKTPHPPLGDGGCWWLLSGDDGMEQNPANYRAHSLYIVAYIFLRPLQSLTGWAYQCNHIIYYGKQMSPRCLVSSDVSKWPAYWGAYVMWNLIYALYAMTRVLDYAVFCFGVFMSVVDSWYFHPYSGFVCNWSIV